jgi:hypothetical protein
MMSDWGVDGWISHKEMQKLLDGYGLDQEDILLWERMWPEIEVFKLHGEPARTVAMLILKPDRAVEPSREKTYVMFSEESGEWKVDGTLASQGDRMDFPHRIEKSYGENQYWIVFTEETSHGTGISSYEEVWWTSSGKEIARFPSEGYVAANLPGLAPGSSFQIKYAASASPSTLDIDPNLHVIYSIIFEYYPYEGTMVRQESWSEEWVLNTETGLLKFKESMLPKEYEPDEGEIEDGDDIAEEGGIVERGSIGWRYLSYILDRAGEKPIETLDDFKWLVETPEITLEKALVDAYQSK